MCLKYSFIRSVCLDHSCFLFLSCHSASAFVSRHLKFNYRLVHITVHRLHITPHRSQVAFPFPRHSAADTDCLSPPPGSAGKGGKSTEAAALLREEAAQQSARD